MSDPLSQVTYNQKAGYLPVNLVSGDTLIMTVAIPFDISAYTFSGAIQDQFGVELFAFTVTADQETPTGILTVSATDVQTATIPAGATYYLQWDNSGDIRTFLAGPVVAVSK